MCWLKFCYVLNFMGPLTLKTHGLQLQDILLCNLFVNFPYTIIKAFYFFDLLVVLWYSIDWSSNNAHFFLSYCLALLFVVVVVLFFDKFSSVISFNSFTDLGKNIYFIFSVGTNIIRLLNYSYCLFLVSLIEYLFLCCWDKSFHLKIILSSFYFFFYSFLFHVKSFSPKFCDL